MKLTAKQGMLRAQEAESIGDFDSALKIYGNILTKIPNHSAAKKNLSELQKVMGGRNSGNTLGLPLEKQVKEIENLQQLGRLEQSERLCKQFIYTSPSADILYGCLGSILFQQGKNLLALKSYGKAILLNPLSALNHLNKALVLESLSRLDESLTSYNKGIELSPDIPKIYLSRAEIYKKKGEFNEAFKDYDHALILDPNFIQALNNKGALHSELGNMSEALKNYESAIKLNPSLAHIYYNKALAHTALGQFKQATIGHQKAVELNPNHGQASYCLANLKSFNLKDSFVTTMEKNALGAKTGSLDRVNFLFALAKIYENAKSYDASFNFLERGNSYRHKLNNYDFQNYVNTFKTIKNIFTDRNLPKVESSQLYSAQRPIFIVGMPRSGTTLVEQLLASHQQVHGAGELRFINELVEEMFEPAQHKTSQNRDFISIDQKLESFSEDYYNKIANLGIRKRFFTDKMPHNFRFLGFILSAMPEAKIIHCRRHPIATCWSIYKTLFGHTGNSFAYDLKSLGSYFKLYEDLMLFWHEKFPGKIYDLSYESLTENQEYESRKLLEFCGLEWEEGCMNFQKTERVVKTASATQVRKKIYRGSSDDWKKFKKHLKPLIVSLGQGNASESK
jgi:tetratricopeptide (TPR) repeat protein